MGKGLMIKPSGVHVAYTAGTGCLVFVDLVAFLVRKNLNRMALNEENQVEKDFKFVFYCSFPNEQESIGLDLCRGLADLCEKTGNKNFEFHCRFSKYTKERWDKKFLEESLSKQGTNLKRIWVCGPPMMNESFDKYLTEIAPKFNLT